MPKHRALKVWVCWHQARHFSLYFLNAALNETLAIFGGVILSVFAQVALGTGFGNRIDNPGSVDCFESVQLGFELLGTAFCDGNGGH